LTQRLARGLLVIDLGLVAARCLLDGRQGLWHIAFGEDACHDGAASNVLALLDGWHVDHFALEIEGAGALMGI
jgi:hypothetical protein